MPSIVPCPSCDKRIRTPDGAEGKKLRCPSCQAMLLITERGLEEVNGQAVRNGGGKSSSGSVRRRDDDDDEPRRKRSRDEDDYDDDDEPRSRRRSRDDDDDDDRPRRRRKRRGGIPMWVWLASGGGVLAIVIILVLVLFVFSGGSKFNKIKEGMTAKEVTDLIGEPVDGDTKAFGIWYYPRIEKKDMTLDKLASLKERLEVQFDNGKVKKVLFLNIEEERKKLMK